MVLISGGVYLASQVTKGAGLSYLLTKWQETTVYLPAPSDGLNSAGGYITNHGQLRNEGGTPNSTVKYYCQKNSPSIYIDDSKVSYIFSSPKADTISPDTLHRVDVKFNKGTTNAKVYSTLERPEYANFYLGHMLGKAERTSISNVVVKSGVYTNTDIVFSNNNSGYRHFIVARSGSPTGDFEMEYSGQNSLSVNGNGALVISTSVGDQIQPKAKVYTMNNTTGVLTLLNWQPIYVINGNLVSFNYTGSWSGTLVIELYRAASAGGGTIENAELEWSTYFGGQEEDEIADITGDLAGKNWSVGTTRSSDFLEIPGPLILNELSAQRDVFVAAFNTDCSADWFTYYGGSDDETGGAIINDFNGEPIIVGSTKSEDFPDEMDGDLDDDLLGGSQDGFIFRLDANGFSTLDSYVGGDGLENVNDVAINIVANQTDIYLVGCTTSNEATFPNVNLNGSYQQNYAGGPIDMEVGDAFIMRLNEETNAPVWKTFFGSSEAEFGYNICIAANHIFIHGTTTSNSYSEDECTAPQDGLFPRCFPNGYWGYSIFENSQGYNHYLAQFDPLTNALEWSTIVASSLQQYSINGGSNSLGDLASPSISDGMLYFTSSTSSFDEEIFPFVESEYPGSYNQLLGINTAPFIMRFKVSGLDSELRWSTFLDGQSSQYGQTVCVSSDRTVYVMGDGNLGNIQEEADWCQTPTSNDIGFPLCNSSEESYMETNISSPSHRSFIVAFDKYDNLIWSTLFGNHFRNETSGSHCAGDYVYLCGASNFPETVEPTWTLREYDLEGFLDYYQEEHGGETDGSITRFHRTFITSTGKDEKASPDGMILYPVPAVNVLFVQIPQSTDGQYTIDIFNSLGQLALTQKFTGNTAQIDIEHFVTGQYTVKATCASLTYTKGFVK